MLAIHSHPARPTLAVDEAISVRGVVHRLRALRGVAFLHLRLPEALIQVVWEGSLPPGLREQSAVAVSGRCVSARLREAALTHRTLEVRATALEVLSTPSQPMPIDVTKPTLSAGGAAVYDHRALSLRHPRVQAVFRVQQAVLCGFREALFAEGFTEIHSPKLGAEGAEGGAEVFELEYFGRRATLAQSPQLYKELCTGAFLRVFEVGPVFRAEKHATSRHLAEYTSLDLEMGPIASFTEVMAMQVRVLAHTFGRVRQTCGHALELLGASVPEVVCVPAIPFAEAKARIGGSATPDLSPAEEQALCRSVCEETGSELVFVTHYPSSKRPFYTMDVPGSEHETCSFDLLFRGVEITTGGQRIHEREALVAKLAARGMNPDAFAFFHATHGYGLPPHGGLGMGLERLTAQLLGLANIREACLFPRDRSRLTP